MRTTRPVNVSIETEAYNRIKSLIKVSGGTVASFGGLWMEELSHLTTQELNEVMRFVETKRQRASVSLSK